MAKVDVSDESEGKRSPIFIQDFADIERPFNEVQIRFAGESEWLSPLASEASEDGEALRMRIGPSWSAGLVTREVNVTLGPSRARGDTVSRSLAWRASELQSLFPLLEGDIELAPIGDDGSRISLAVVYTPPLGGLGARVDRALLHRVAASTVRSFISKVALNLERSD
ncbi:MAG: hypothetical protein HIU84_04085 [Acidobacteria bacterium]|nr:hypothetical protein [Acidobacteriota bacterium]